MWPEPPVPRYSWRSSESCVLPEEPEPVMWTLFAFETSFFIWAMIWFAVISATPFDFGPPPPPHPASATAPTASQHAHAQRMPRR